MPLFENFFKFLFVLETKLEMIGEIILHSKTDIQLKLSVEYLKDLKSK